MPLEDGTGLVTKDFRSARAASWLLAGLAGALWVVLMFVASNHEEGQGFSPGPGSVLLFALAVTATCFSAAAYAVSWVAVVVREASRAALRAQRDAAGG